MLTAAPAPADEVTADRLIHADREPHNWLMNHRSYDGQRFSPLTGIDRGNVARLKVAMALALGNGARTSVMATPLAEDGLLYVTDSDGVLYRIDVRDGATARIVWRMDPGQMRPDRNRGAALWGRFVVTAANEPPRVIATDKETGKVAWEHAFPDTPDIAITAAPLAVKDKIIVGAANGDQGVRDFIAALDAATGRLLWRRFTVPAPGEPGSETWKDNHGAWRTGGGAVWVTGTYDPPSDQTIWGTGNPTPMFDPTYRPGDNLFTNSAISWNPDSGAMNWHVQYTPGDRWDYDEVGTHILIAAKVGEAMRGLVVHSARNGFLYTMDLRSGATVLAKPYTTVNWTRGIDQKTGRPLDYDPGRDVQIYAGVAAASPGGPAQRVCPGHAGGNNFWPSSYSPRTGLIYIPALSGCEDIAIDAARHSRKQGWSGGSYAASGRYESDLVAMDPVTGDIRKTVHRPYSNEAGMLSTAGGLVFTAFADGTVAAFDDTTLDELWRFNAGSGISAPPMSFAVGDRQYVAIVTGPGTGARARLVNTPELRDQGSAAMLFIFGL